MTFGAVYTFKALMHGVTYAQHSLTRSELLHTHSKSLEHVVFNARTTAPVKPVFLVVGTDAGRLGRAEHVAISVDGDACAS